MAFLDDIFKERKIKTIFGNPKLGMTNTSILILERLYEEGYRIHTNFKVKK